MGARSSLVLRFFLLYLPPEPCFALLSFPIAFPLPSSHWSRLNIISGVPASLPDLDRDSESEWERERGDWLSLYALSYTSCPGIGQAHYRGGPRAAFPRTAFSPALLRACLFLFFLLLPPFHPESREFAAILPPDGRVRDEIIYLARYLGNNIESAPLKFDHSRFRLFFKDKHSISVCLYVYILYYIHFRLPLINRSLVCPCPLPGRD